MSPMNKTRKRHGGGMPLSYLNRSYSEPSASSGSNVNQFQAGLARPALNLTGGRRKLQRKNGRKSRHAHSGGVGGGGGGCGCMKQSGGFMPSVMGSFIQNAKMLFPAVCMTCYRMWKNYSKPAKKTRRR